MVLDSASARITRDNVVTRVAGKVLMIIDSEDLHSVRTPPTISFSLIPEVNTSLVNLDPSQQEVAEINDERETSAKSIQL